MNALDDDIAHAREQCTVVARQRAAADDIKDFDKHDKALDGHLAHLSQLIKQRQEQKP